MRKLLLQFHLIAGCIAAPFLFIAGASGALVVFEGPYTTSVANAKLTHVEPGSALLSLDALRDSIRVRMPGVEVVSTSLHLEGQNSYTFAVRTSGAKDVHALYVDPWRGTILGDDAAARAPLRWAHDLHTRLLYQANGKTIVAWTAVVLVLLSLSGLYLWWPGKILRVRRDASGRRKIFELHNLLGGLSWVLMLIFGLTGVVVHWENESGAFIRAVTGTAEAATPPKATESCVGQPLASLDLIKRNMDAAMPGAEATTISFGDKPKDYAVARMRFPEDMTPAGRTLVFAERCTGHVVWSLATREAPLSYRLTRMWNRSVHTGDVWGWPSRILAVLAALTLPLMALTGPLIWWTRRRKARA